MERKSADLTFEVKDNMDEEKNVREKGKRKKKRKITKSVHPKVSVLLMLFSFMGGLFLMCHQHGGVRLLI